MAELAGGVHREGDSPDPPRGLSDLTIGAEDRTVIVGAAGEGKSVLATSILSRWERVLVYNLKGLADPDVMAMPNSTVAWNARDALAAIPGRVIYVPALGEGPAEFDQLVAKIWRLGGRHAIGIHEPRQLVIPGQKFAPQLSRAYTVGRAYRMPIVTCAVSPVGLPTTEVWDMSVHFFVLFMPDERHRDDCRAFMGPQVREPLPRFCAWYRRSGMHEAVKLPPVDYLPADGATV